MNSVQQEFSPSFAMLTEKDAPAMAELEQLCFTLPWTEEQYRAAFKHSIFYAYGLLGEGLLAYVTIYAVADTLEILNVATRPDLRRRGYARQLLQKVIEVGRHMDMTEAVLEVRRTNVAAIGLYTDLGFVQTGMRKGYYPDTGEDALIYTATFMA